MQSAARVDSSSRNLISLVYVSSAMGHLDQVQMDGLRASSRRFNAAARVTGTLLHHDGAFWQYLEGSRRRAQGLKLP